MTNSVHCSLEDLKHKKGDIVLPHVDIGAFSEETREKFDRLIADLLSKRQESGKGDENA